MNFAIIIVSIVYIAWWVSRGNWHDFSVILVLMICGLNAVIELCCWWIDE